MISEFKYLKGNNLKKSLQVNKKINLQKSQKLFNESKKLGKKNYKFYDFVNERSKSIDPLNLNDNFQNQNLLNSEIDKINLTNSELQQKDSIEKHAKRVNSLRQKRKNRNQDLQDDSDTLINQNLSNPSVFLKVK